MNTFFIIWTSSGFVKYFFKNFLAVMKTDENSIIQKRYAPMFFDAYLFFNARKRQTMFL
ncbi:hypothetical protein B4119_0902 [Parageobacillus caldoxylosilyticus]|uniref:Uncharacterized protein n=1 Tax=Saccharococcus caldoxylosilyticus TaxID=81408 RepID=A0A150LFN5_9BACL|nr:hypothetical protein B4119_0902 [Parageobacillus caldoxylosilyticus]